MDSILLSKFKLRKFILSLSEKDLERVKKNFHSALEDRRLLDLERQQENEKRIAFLKRVEQMAAEEGVDVSGLLDDAPRSAKSTPKKYRMVLECGTSIEWSGRGRPPKPFAEALSSGKTLNDFLIVENK